MAEKSKPKIQMGPKGGKIQRVEPKKEAPPPPKKRTPTRYRMT